MNDPRAPQCWHLAPPLAELPRHASHVFAIDLEEKSNHERLLSPTERERGSRFHRAEDRRRFVVAHAELRRIVAGMLDMNPEEIAFGQGANGKPELVGQGAEPALRFNLSGSHNMALVAIQHDHDIGVDIERVRAFPDSIGIAQRFFTGAEHQRLASLPDAERDAAFVSYWIRKEAIVKAYGVGLSQLATVPELRADPGGAVEYVILSSATWCVQLPPPAPGYVAALAATGPVRRVQCWHWTANHRS